MIVAARFHDHFFMQTTKGFASISISEAMLVALSYPNSNFATVHLNREARKVRQENL